ncbi:hypothetical protein Tco_0146328 [Tanacetum coccineum]
MLTKNKLGKGNKRLKGRDWTDDDVMKSNKMVRKIDQTLKHREHIRRLEEYVGGRPKIVNPYQVDAFDSDCNEAPRSSAIFMARLFPMGSINGDDMEHSEQLNDNYDFHIEITSDNNVISYADYMKTIENDVHPPVLLLKQDNVGLKLRKTPSRSFRPVKSAKILWQFWLQVHLGFHLLMMVLGASESPPCGCVVNP